MTEMLFPWCPTLFLALTGEKSDVRVEPTTLYDALTILPDLLNISGWSTKRISEHALAQIEAGNPWPHQIAIETVRKLGPARYAAALEEARKALGLWVLQELPPSTRSKLNADELRLLSDVPPHHGS